MKERIKEIESQSWYPQTNLINTEKFVELFIQEIESYIEESEGDIDYVRFLIDRNLK